MRTRNVVAFILSVVLASAALAQAPEKNAKGGSKMAGKAPVVRPAGDLKWADLDSKGAPGVKIADVWGDHSKGALGAFVQLPAGFAAPLHTHTNDMKITIVSGTFIQEPEGKPDSGWGPVPT